MRTLFLLFFWGLLGHNSFSQITYTFAGNGYWTTAANWTGNRIPPSILRAPDTILIRPGVGDSCILNTPQTISPGASLVVAPGGIFILREGIVNQEPVLRDSLFIDQRDGQTYTYRHIGTQVWITTNLNYATDSGSWCFDKNGYLSTVYGRLYDWNTAKYIAPPPGWHLPSAAEWQTLFDLFGGNPTAGGSLKKTGSAHWSESPFSGATNRSRFSALPGGYRATDGSFNGIGNYGDWWTSSEQNIYNAEFRIMAYDNPAIFGDNSNKGSAFAVRCIRDSDEIPIIYTFRMDDAGTGTASFKGIIASNGGSSLLSSGLVLDTLPLPTVTLPTKITNALLTDTFINQITGLLPGKTYYARTYATNSLTTGYGNTISFTAGVPGLITNPLINITETGATSGGLINNPGAAPVTTTGLVWSRLPRPVISLPTKTVNTGTASVFSNTIQGLQSGNTYYIRAYATNAYGTAYGNELEFNTVLEPDSLYTDPRDGQVYAYRRIGGQVWMTRNLNYESVAGSWCYANNISNCQELGRLYRWDTALRVAPPGWHLPDSTEWQILINYLGGNATAGDKMKEMGTRHWITPNRYADNRVRFSALPGGNKDYSSSSFFGQGNYGYWWSATQRDSIHARGCTLYNIYPAADLSYSNKNYGFSVRCIKDTLLSILPVLTTKYATAVTGTSALSGGFVITGGRTPVTFAGLVWDTLPHPTIALANKTMMNLVNSSFDDSISGLIPGKTYYLRAYATNSGGTGYGNEISFTTAGLPVLTTIAATSISINSAVSGGSIASNGGSAILTTGLVWDTLPNPIITLSTKTINTPSGSSFSDTITGLQASRVYYVRAYATNLAGTGYGNPISFTTADSTFTDPRDGNVYTFRRIGSQVWMTRNLNYATASGSWCFNNSVANCNVYGRLYTWDSALVATPAGWHLPSDDEWQTLIDFLGGSGVAGGAMKSTTLWNSPNTGAVNSSGFTGLPGGIRHSNGTFNNLGDYGHWWSATDNNAGSAWFRYLSAYFSNIVRNSGGSKAYGYSVRCVRND